MKKLNLSIILRVIASLLDDALIIVIIIWVMSLLGFKAPLWFIILLAAIFLSLGVVSYLALMKNPTLGFENMIGRSGLTVETINKRGTVRIGHQLWHAESHESIEKGLEVIVVSQSGLKLSVVKR